MKELSSKSLSLLRYVPYVIDENPKIQRFLSCLPFIFKDRIEYNNPKPLRKQRGKLISVMNKEKIKEKVYLTGRVKEQIILNKEGKNLSPTEISEIILETILRILTKEHTLKVIHNIILRILVIGHTDIYFKLRKLLST